MAEKPLIDISPENWKIVRSILQRYVPDREVWAFGSRTKWTAKEFSDLDIAVISDAPMSIALVADLDEAFQESALPFKVDVVDWATITSAFRQVIQAGKVRIQESQEVVNWTTKLVSDIAYLNPSRSLKKGTVSPFIEMAALPVNGRDIPVQDVSTRNFSGSGSRFMNGDVLLARITPCLENGKTALVNVLSPSVVGHGSTEFIVLSAKESSDQRFIYYLARHPDFREYAIQHMEGTSGRQRVSATSVGAYRFLCPPASERKEIGDILGALDDKIALLRETNATLEAIAQAIFKSWFVDFDPVRAKMEGRKTEGMDADTAALFPDGFEDSALGEIPRGWQVRSLDTIATYLNGLALQKFPPESEDEFLPVIKIAQLRAGSSHGADRASARLKPEYIVKDGDVLFSWSGSLEVEIWCGGEGALNQHLFKVTSSEVPKWFYYLATRHFLPRFREIAAHKATTMGHIQRVHLTEARIALPPSPVLEQLSGLVAPLLERRILGALQARELGTLRDSLLPSLMSGRVPPLGESKLVEVRA